MALYAAPWPESALFDMNVQEEGGRGPAATGPSHAASQAGCSSALCCAVQPHRGSAAAASSSGGHAAVGLAVWHCHKLWRAEGWEEPVRPQLGYPGCEWHSLVHAMHGSQYIMHGRSAPQQQWRLLSLAAAAGHAGELRVWEAGQGDVAVLVRGCARNLELVLTGGAAPRLRVSLHGELQPCFPLSNKTWTDVGKRN